MTKKQLAEIEARLKAATPGPWRDTDSDDGTEGLLQVVEGEEPLTTAICLFCDMEECEGQDLHNAKFVANAPTDIAALLTELRRLQALLDLPTLDMIMMDVTNREDWTPGELHETS